METETIVGVMGPGDGATPNDKDKAFNLGKAIARQSWILLTGGRQEGVMNTSMKGAQEEDGQTIGILPGTDSKGMSPYVDIPIFSGMGHGRNAINIHSSQLIFACGLGAGTSSEISLALKKNTAVILLNQSDTTLSYFQQLSDSLINPSDSVEQAITIARDLLK